MAERALETGEGENRLLLGWDPGAAWEVQAQELAGRGTHGSPE